MKNLKETEVVVEFLIQQLSIQLIIRARQEMEKAFGKGQANDLVAIGDLAVKQFEGEIVARVTRAIKTTTRT